MDSDCPSLCTGHGVCRSGMCLCDLEWEGLDCDTYNPSNCENNCGNAGLCRFGRCFCDPGFTGDACQLPMPCPDNCLNRGVCRHGKCFCLHNYMGETCALDSKQEMKPQLQIYSFKQDKAAVKSACPNDCN